MNSDYSLYDMGFIIYIERGDQNHIPFYFSHNYVDFEFKFKYSLSTAVDQV